MSPGLVGIVWEIKDVSTPIDMTPSKRGRHRHEENRDHHERNKKFANHRTEISQQTSPAGPAGIYHSFAGDEFTGDRANHRSKKKSDDPEEDTDDGPKQRAE